MASIANGWFVPTACPFVTHLSPYPSLGRASQSPWLKRLALLSILTSMSCVPLSRFGAFLPGVELFDCAAFSLNEREAALMDPQQRLLLQAVAEAAAAATAAPSGPQGSSGPAAGQGPTVGLLSGVLRAACGVYVGVSALDYSRLAAR